MGRGFFSASRCLGWELETPHRYRYSSHSRSSPSRDRARGAADGRHRLGWSCLCAGSFWSAAGLTVSMPPDQPCCSSAQRQYRSLRLDASFWAGEEGRLMPPALPEEILDTIKGKLLKITGPSQTRPNRKRPIRFRPLPRHNNAMDQAAAASSSERVRAAAMAFSAASGP